LIVILQLEKIQNYCMVQRVHWKVTIGHDPIIGGNTSDRTIIGNRVETLWMNVHAQRDCSGG